MGTGSMDVTLLPIRGQGPDSRSSVLPHQMPQHPASLLPELLTTPPLGQALSSPTRDMVCPVPPQERRTPGWWGHFTF